MREEPNLIYPSNIIRERYRSEIAWSKFYEYGWQSNVSFYITFYFNFCDN